MLLTFELIREISLNEKQEKLQELPENFFENAKEYLKSKKGTIEEVSAGNLIENIFARRQKKILELCFHLYKTNRIPENLEKDEEEFYLSMSLVLRNFYENFKKRILEQTETTKQENMENQSENNEIKGEQNIENQQKTITETKGEIDPENHTTINNETREERNMETQIENNNKITGKSDVENQLRTNTETRKGTNIEKERLEEVFATKQEINAERGTEQTDINKTEAKSDKTKVIFLKDVPEIISPGFEICCFKKGEEIELEQEFAGILKEKGLCEIV